MGIWFWLWPAACGVLDQIIATTFTSSPPFTSFRAYDAQGCTKSLEGAPYFFGSCPIKSRVMIFPPSPLFDFICTKSVELILFQSHLKKFIRYNNDDSLSGTLPKQTLDIDGMKDMILINVVRFSLGHNKIEMLQYSTVYQTKL